MTTTGLLIADMPPPPLLHASVHDQEYPFALSEFEDDHLWRGPSLTSTTPTHWKAFARRTRGVPRLLSRAAIRRLSVVRLDILYLIKACVLPLSPDPSQAKAGKMFRDYGTTQQVTAAHGCFCVQQHLLLFDSGNEAIVRAIPIIIEVLDYYSLIAMYASAMPTVVKRDARHNTGVGEREPKVPVQCAAFPSSSRVVDARAGGGVPALLKFEAPQMSRDKCAGVT
ncbi:hypothetical protein EDB83DRAFT_2309852 [Lactarius deliciosus]|nr:hypothetical protein EDB83DRAFT_2309852 [Lactarius deliciosus]